MAYSVGSLFASLGLDASEFVAGLNKAIEQSEKFVATAKDVGLSLTAAFTLPLAAIGGTAITAFAEFEASLSRIRALGGDEFAPAMQKIEQAALDMGKSTRFSAKEVSDAMGELTAAGFSATEVLTAIPGVAKLAAIENIKLADATRYASDIMKGFGLSADALEETVDILAKASAISAVSVKELASSFSYVGPVAKVTGDSVRDIAAALAVLANQGIRGEKGGTALRNMMGDLMNMSPQAAKAMEKLGITFKDAAGKMLPMEQRIEALQPLLKNTEAAFKVFGVRASDVFALIADPTAFKAAAKNLENVKGAAESMTKIMQDNLSAGWTKFLANLNTAAIQLGKILAPVAKYFLDIGVKVAEFVNDAIMWFGKLPSSVQLFTGAVLGAVALVGPALLGLAGVIKGITMFRDFFTQLDTLGEFMKLFRIQVDAANNSIKILGISMKMLSFDNLSTAGISRSLESIGSVITKSIGGAMVAVAESVRAVPGMVSSAFTGLGQMALTAGNDIKIALVGAWMAVKDGALAAVNAMKSFSITSAWTSLRTSIIAASVAMWDYVKAVAAAQIANLKLAATNVADAFSGIIKAFSAGGLSGGFAAIGTSLTGLVSMISGPVLTTLSGLGTAIAGITAPAWAVGAAITALAASVGYAAYLIVEKWDYVTKVFNAFLADMVEIWGGIKKVVSAAIDGYFGSGTAAMIGRWVDVVIGFFKNLGGYIKVIFQEVGGWFLKLFEWIAKAAQLKNTAAALAGWGSGAWDAEGAAKQANAGTEANRKAQELAATMKGVEGTIKSIADLTSKYSNGVRLGTAAWQEGAKQTQNMSALAGKLLQQQNELREKLNKGVINQAQFDEANLKIQAALMSANQFATQFQAGIGSAGVHISRLGDKAETTAEKMKKAFETALKGIVDLTGDLPQTMNQFMRSMAQAPEQIFKAFDQMEEKIRDVMNNKGLSEAKKQQLIQYVRDQQVALADLAQQAGMLIEGSIDKTEDAYKFAKQYGVDLFKDTLSIIGSVPQTLEEVAKKSAAALKKIRDDARSLGRTVDPEKDRKLDNQAKEDAFAALIGVPFSEIETAMKAAGVSAEKLKAQVHNGATEATEGLATTATKQLAIVQKVAEKTGQVFSGALIKSTANADAEAYFKRMGMSLEEIGKLASDSGSKFDKNFFRPVKEVTQEFTVQREKAEAYLGVLQKHFEETGKGAREIRDQVELINLRRWEEQNGVAFESFARDLKNAGVNLDEFKKRITSGGDAFKAMAEDARREYDALRMSGVATAEELQNAWQNVMDANMAAQFGRSVKQIEADFQSLGVTLNNISWKKTFGDIAELERDVERYRAAGLLTADQLLTAYENLEKRKSEAMQAYFNTLSLETNKFSDIVSAASDLAMQKGIEAATVAANEFRKNVTGAMTDAVTSLFSFDSGKISASFKKLGDVALTSLQKMLITPFQTMFNTMIDSVTGVITKFVTDQVLGLLMGGLNQVMGIIPQIGNGIASVFGAATNAKDIAGVLTNTTKLAGETVKATSLLATNSSVLAKATANFATNGAELGKAATQVTNAATQATGAATQATKAVSSALSSVMSTIGSVASIASAITGLFSFLSQRRMEKDIARIEESTRWTKGLLIEVRDALIQGPLFPALSSVQHEIAVQGSQLFEQLVNNRDTLGGALKDILEQLKKGIAVSGGQAPQETTVDDPKSMPEDPKKDKAVSDNTEATDKNTTSTTANTTTTDTNTQVTDANTTATTSATDATVANTSATDDQSAKVAESTEAFKALAGNLPEWAQKFTDFVDKGSKELTTYVQGFGSNLTMTSKLVENGMYRIAVDTATGTRFLVETATNRIVRILKAEEYASEQVVKAQGELTDATNSASSAINDYSATTSAAANSTSGAFKSLVVAATSATQSLSDITRAVAKTVEKTMQVVDGKLVDVQQPFTPTQVDTQAVQGALSFQRIDGKGNPIIDYTPGAWNPNNISGMDVPRNTLQNLTVNVTAKTNATPKEIADQVIGVVRSAGVDL